MKIEDLYEYFPKKSEILSSLDNNIKRSDFISDKNIIEIDYIISNISIKY